MRKKRKRGRPDLTSWKAKRMIWHRYHPGEPYPPELEKEPEPEPPKVLTNIEMMKLIAQRNEEALGREITVKQTIEAIKFLEEKEKDINPFKKMEDWQIVEHIQKIVSSITKEARLEISHKRNTPKTTERKVSGDSGSDRGTQLAAE